MTANQQTPTADLDERDELQRRLTRDTPLRIGVIMIVVAFGGFFVWASLAPLSEGVVATGQVVVDTAHKAVQHLEGGIVEALHVREGSEVHAGEEVEFQRLDHILRVHETRINLLRILGTLDDDRIDLPGEHDAAVAPLPPKSWRQLPKGMVRR